MSYLEKTNFKFWDFDEAYQFFLDQNGGSETNAIGAFSRALSSKTNKTALQWKANWKVMKQSENMTSFEN